jgi:M6 family metalloprotease-like protein
VAWLREGGLLKNAIDAVAAQIPPGLDIDADCDGYVDNVCFIVSGDVDAWADLLWPHMAWLTPETAMINGQRVRTFNFQLRAVLGVGVLSHEMFHSLGSPDLYHYSFDGLSPVGKWDIMEWDLDPPQHMGAYMKYRYGHWISSIPTISDPGTYTLWPLLSVTNNCYKIPSPFSSKEYFVVEYRKRTGTFERSMPGEGLLVYRINSDIIGNNAGPPDEVYVYRPGGTPTANGIPDSAAYSGNSGRVALSDITSPSSYLTDGSPGGLNLTDVGFLGDTIIRLS